MQRLNGDRTGEVDVFLGGAYATALHNCQE
jgi:hypothetical protein